MESVDQILEEVKVLGNRSYPGADQNAISVLLRQHSLEQRSCRFRAIDQSELCVVASGFQLGSVTIKRGARFFWRQSWPLAVVINLWIPANEKYCLPVLHECLLHG